MNVRRRWPASGPGRRRGRRAEDRRRRSSPPLRPRSALRRRQRRHAGERRWQIGPGRPNRISFYWTRAEPNGRCLACEEDVKPVRGRARGCSSGQTPPPTSENNFNQRQIHQEDCRSIHGRMPVHVAHGGVPPPQPRPFVAEKRRDGGMKGDARAQCYFRCDRLRRSATSAIGLIFLRRNIFATDADDMHWLTTCSANYEVRSFKIQLTKSSFAYGNSLRYTQQYYIYIPPCTKFSLFSAVFDA